MRQRKEEVGWAGRGRVVGGEGCATVVGVRGWSSGWGLTSPAASVRSGAPRWIPGIHPCSHRNMVVSSDFECCFPFPYPWPVVGFVIVMFNFFSYSRNRPFCPMKIIIFCSKHMEKKCHNIWETPSQQKFVCATAHRWSQQIIKEKSCA